MTSPQRKIRVAQVGIGNMGKVWLEFLLANPDIEIVGLCDINNKVIKELNEKLKGNNIYVHNHYEHMLRHAKPDFVLDVTPPHVRRITLKYYLENNINVLSEKPLVDNPDTLSKILKLAKKSKSKIMVNQNYRWHEGSKFIQQIISNGDIGKVKSINCYFRVNYHIKGWRRELRHSFLLDMAIHHFDLFRYFTGSNGKELSCIENEVSNATIELSNNEVVNYSGSWSSKNINTSLNGEWVIEGDSGALRWDGNHKIAKYANNTEEILYIKKQNKDKLEISLDLFIHSLRKNTRIPTTVGDHSNTLAMVFAACKSSDIKKLVAV